MSVSNMYVLKLKCKKLNTPRGFGIEVVNVEELLGSREKIKCVE